jgi:hypothetical protein
MAEQEEKAVAVVDPQIVLSKINAIDTNALAEGGPKILDATIIEKRAMWDKAKILLDAYPELEESYNKPGKRKKDSDVMTLVALEPILGRTRQTMSKWISLYLSVGKTEKEFQEWAKKAALVAQETWERKLLAEGTDRKKPEPDVKKAMENKTYLAIKERVDSGEYSTEDLEYALAQWKKCIVAIKKAIQYLLDEKPDKALAAIEKIIEETE